MSINGKITTLYEDKNNTSALFPKTKISAVSDINGIGLDAILDKKVNQEQLLDLNAKTFNGLTDQEWFNKLYPIGSFWISANPTSPATLFPGTFWEKIEDVMLLGASARHPAGSTGGAETATLKTANLPAVSANAIISAYTGLVTGPNPGPGSEFGYALSGKSGNSGGEQRLRVDIPGESKPLSIVSPYLAVYIWKRIEKPEV